MSVSSSVAITALLVANLGTLCAEFAGVAAGMDLLGGVSKYVSVPLAAVGLQLLPAGFSEVDPMTWGHRIIDSSVVEHVTDCRPGSGGDG